MIPTTTGEPKTVWVVMARHVWVTRVEFIGPWSELSESAAKKRVRALNAEGSWLRDAGFRAYIVGEFSLKPKRRAR